MIPRLIQDVYKRQVQNAVEIQNGSKDKSELGVKAIDDKTLEVTLKAPCNYFIEIVAAAVTSPVRQDVIEANGEMWYENPETYIGNGAYKLVEWSHQEKIVMEANDKYYDYANPVSYTHLDVYKRQVNTSRRRCFL